MIPVILWSKFNKRERKDEYLVTVDNCLFFLLLEKWKRYVSKHTLETN